MSEHIRLLSLSKRFLDSARDIAAQGGEGWRFPVPHYLAGHALELALKSHLAHRGADEATLIKLGHRLNAALARADASVRAVLTREQAIAIRWLHPYYAGKELEYTAWGATGRLIEIPELSYIVGAAEAVYHHLDRIYRAEVRARRKP